MKIIYPFYPVDLFHKFYYHNVIRGGWIEIMERVQDNKTKEVLEKIIHRIVQAYRPEQIYLFGSVARGEAGADSDFDIMVVVSDYAPEEKQRSRLAYQALRGTGIAVDILVWTKKSFEERLHLQASLPATIIREGKLLYAA